MKLLLISFLKVITISKTYTALVETILFDLIVGFPNSSVGKESPCIAGDPGSIPGLGRSTGETLGYPLQYSGLENSMDCVVHRLQRVGHN